VDGIRLHFKHLTATLGESYPIGELSLEALQKHVDRRAKAKGTNGRRLSSATIKKEIVSLRIAWDRGVNASFVRTPYRPSAMAEKNLAHAGFRGGASEVTDSPDLVDADPLVFQGSPIRDAPAPSSIPDRINHLPGIRHEPKTFEWQRNWEGNCICSLFRL
jgi:hypothetical protein